MSASQPANMRGRRVKTPLMLLLLLTTLTGTALCQDEDTETKEENAGDSGDMETAEELLVAPNTTLAPGASTTLPTAPADENIDSDHGSGLRHGLTGDSGMSDTMRGHRTDVLEPTEVPTFEDLTTPIGSEEGPLELIIILIPAVLVVVIIATIVCGIVVCRRSSNAAKNEALRKEDPYLDDCCTEKVPMPMFEEDVPSVLELEMEELDQWMKKDGPEDSLSKQS